MSWWRRQRVPLIALLVAAVAAAGVHIWLDVLPVPQAHPPAVVDVAGRAEVAGQTISISGVRWDEFDAPVGSRTISVRLDANGGEEAATCGPFVLSETDGPREWLDARAEFSVPFDAGERSCLEESLPYKIFAVFLVPDDAVGPFHLSIPDTDRVTRFLIEP